MTVTAIPGYLVHLVNCHRNSQTVTVIPTVVSPVGNGDDYKIGKPFHTKGGRTFLVGGAGNDREGLYLPLLKETFERHGIAGVEITDSSISLGWQLDAATVLMTNNLRRPQDYARYTGKIGIDIPKDGQLNFVGYSNGAVLVAQTALAFAYSGYKVDNVVLLGAPVNNDLLKGLALHPNVGQVTVLNLSEFGDPIRAGMSDTQILKAVPTLNSQMGSHTGHFVYSQPGPLGDLRRNYLGALLYRNGVR